MTGDLHIQLIGRPRIGWGYVCHIDGRILAAARVGEHEHVGKAIADCMAAVKVAQAAGREQEEGADDE